MYSVKSIPDDAISLDIHFQNDLTITNVAILAIELVCVPRNIFCYEIHPGLLLMSIEPKCLPLRVVV